MKKIFFILTLITTLSLNAQTSPNDFLKEAINYIDAKQYDQALISVNKAVVLDSSQVTAWYLRGYIKYQLKDYEGAITDLSETINLDDEYLEAYYYRGLAKNQTNNFMGAYKDLNKSKDIAPQDSRVVVLKGIIKAIIT